jgi:hypothetical protein
MNHTLADADALRVFSVRLVAPLELAPAVTDEQPWELLACVSAVGDAARLDPVTVADQVRHTLLFLRLSTVGRFAL